MNSNYLIITLSEEIEQYSLKMLINNNVSGILLLELRIIDNRKCYYYNITSKQSLSNLIEKGLINQLKIKELIIEIIQIMEKTQEYLLLEDEFILNPEYIYLDNNSFKVSLCYLPGYKSNIKQQFCQLIEYFMNKINYKDKDTVLLIYSLYQVSREEDCTFKKIYAILNEKIDEEINEEVHEKIEPILNEKEKQQPIFMEEKIEDEVEVEKYSIKATMISIFSILFCFTIFIILIKSGFLINDGKRDFVNVAIVSIIFICLEGIVLNKIWKPENKIAKVKNRKNYIIVNKKGKDIKEKQIDKFDKEETELLTNYSSPAEQSVFLQSLERENKENIKLTSFPFLIGKLKENVDYSLNYYGISRIHAKIENYGKEYYIIDLNSTNGTYINGNRIESNKKQRIELGDEIAFAQIKYQFLSLL